MKIQITLAAALITMVGCSRPKPPSPEMTDASTTSSQDLDTTPPPAETATPDMSGDAYAASTIYFDYDSYSVRPDARETLRSLAESLKANEGARIQIEGHCDERGSNEYNLALGARRAKSVEEFLISEGVSAANLTTISYGEERPAVDGSSEDAWTRNRRAEFKPQ